MERGGNFYEILSISIFQTPPAPATTMLLQNSCGQQITSPAMVQVNIIQTSTASTSYFT